AGLRQAGSLSDIGLTAWGSRDFTRGVQGGQSIGEGLASGSVDGGDFQRLSSDGASNTRINFTQSRSTWSFESRSASSATSFSSFSIVRMRRSRSDRWRYHSMKLSRMKRFRSRNVMYSSSIHRRMELLGDNSISSLKSWHF